MKKMKHIQIKNRGSPNSSVRKLTKIFMYNKIKLPSLVVFSKKTIEYEVSYKV